MHPNTSGANCTIPSVHVQNLYKAQQCLYVSGKNALFGFAFAFGLVSFSSGTCWLSPQSTYHLNWGNGIQLLFCSSLEDLVSVEVLKMEKQIVEKQVGCDCMVYFWFLSIAPPPFTPKSDQFQISPAASPEILHHAVWRIWLFIAYSDKRWLCYHFSLPHLYISL